MDRFRARASATAHTARRRLAAPGGTTEQCASRRCGNVSRTVGFNSQLPLAPVRSPWALCRRKAALNHTPHGAQRGSPLQRRRRGRPQRSMEVPLRQSFPAGPRLIVRDGIAASFSDRLRLIGDGLGLTDEGGVRIKAAVFRNHGREHQIAIFVQAHICHIASIGGIQLQHTRSGGDERTGVKEVSAGAVLVD